MMSGRISDIEMQDNDWSEKENDGGVVNLTKDDSSSLDDDRVSEGTGDLNLKRWSRGRVRALPARFRDSVMDLGKKKKSGGSRDRDGVNKGRKRMRSDSLDNDGRFNKKSTESEGSLQIHDDIRHDLSLSLAKDDDEQGMACDDENKFVGEKKMKNRKAMEKIFYRLENIQVGDVVWARYSKGALAWPALVIDPLKDAPKSVFRAWVLDKICVMFFGYSKKGARVISLLLYSLTWKCVHL